MNLFRRLEFDLKYLRRPPWESGIVPPEVEAFIRDNPPGRAIDLGCGTGTSSLALARASWTVTGVDFARRAIHLAIQKACLANLSVDFLIADVTRLPSNLFTIPYNLVLDVGCFHSLSPSSQASYFSQLNRLLAKDGIWLLYGFLKSDDKSGPGSTPGLLKHIEFNLIKRQDGLDRRTRPSAWFWFQKA